ncbi:MAG: ABC transporter permease, partial [Clostridia bacterium]|nr:ABC transporter permease [Clostridia bacterium]
LLSTLFGMAFQNINKGVAFTKIPIAVVDNAEFKKETAFQTALASVSGGSSSSQELFVVTKESQTQAENDLKSAKIKGYILFSDGAHVVVKESDIDQTILKEFVNTALQTEQSVKTAISAAPAAAQGILASVSNQKEYLRDVSPNTSKPDDSLTYYYALIAMASLYGSFWGLKEVCAVQANLSAQGARVSLAPVHKLRVFGASLCAATLVDLISILLLIAYMALVIGVKFGNNLPFILLASFAGCCTGVSFGALVGAVIRKRMGLKVSILIGLSMIMSFLSGLMFNDFKYIAVKAVPVLAYINPGNLIADAFYALYYYTSHARFFLNVGLLFGFTLLFYLIVYFVMRRQKYESL